MKAKVTIELDSKEYADLMDVLNEAKYLFNAYGDLKKEPQMVRDDKDYTDLAIIAQRSTMLLEGNDD